MPFPITLFDFSNINKYMIYIYIYMKHVYEYTYVAGYRVSYGQALLTAAVLPVFWLFFL